MIDFLGVLERAEPNGSGVDPIARDPDPVVKIGAFLHFGTIAADRAEALAAREELTQELDRLETTGPLIDDGVYKQAWLARRAGRDLQRSGRRRRDEG